MILLFQTTINKFIALIIIVVAISISYSIIKLMYISLLKKGIIKDKSDDARTIFGLTIIVIYGSIFLIWLIIGLVKIIYDWIN